MDYQTQIDQAKVASQKWRKENPIVGVGRLRVDLMVDDLIKSITELLARAEAAEARAEKAGRERDAAVSDLLRAEEAAEEAGALLDSEVHPICDYSLYLDIHDSVSEIVNWKKDDVWRKKE